MVRRGAHHYKKPGADLGAAEGLSTDLAYVLAVVTVVEWFCAKGETGVVRQLFGGRARPTLFR